MVLTDVCPFLVMISRSCDPPKLAMAFCLCLPSTTPPSQLSRNFGQTSSEWTGSIAKIARWQEPKHWTGLCLWCSPCSWPGRTPPALTCSPNLICWLMLDNCDLVKLQPDPKVPELFPIESWKQQMRHRIVIEPLNETGGLSSCCESETGGFLFSDLGNALNLRVTVLSLYSRRRCLLQRL